MTTFPDAAAVNAEVLRVLELVLGIDRPAGVLVRETCPEWDSLNHVQIVFALEDAFGLEFSLEELAELSDSDVITRHIMDRLRA